MTHFEYRTRVDGTIKVKCDTLKEAIERGYDTAETLPLDPDYLPCVSVFDEHGFVLKIDRVDIEKSKILKAEVAPEQAKG